MQRSRGSTPSSLQKVGLLNAKAEQTHHRRKLISAACMYDKNVPHSVGHYSDLVTIVEGWNKDPSHHQVVID